jgi:hypothetical protein
MQNADDPEKASDSLHLIIYYSVLRLKYEILLRLKN